MREKEVFILDTNFILDGFFLKEGRYVFKNDLIDLGKACKRLNFHLVTSSACIDEIFEKPLKTAVMKILEVIEILKHKALNVKTQLDYIFAAQTPQWQDLTLILAAEKFGHGTIVSSDFHLVNMINMIKHANILPWSIDAEFNGNFLLELGELTVDEKQAEAIRRVWKRTAEIELKRMITSPNADAAERMAEYLMQYARRREERVDAGFVLPLNRLIASKDDDRMQQFFENKTIARLWMYFKK
ncbi:MAG: hypothetical protein ACTSRU_14080 [Candidatus Hodarchaeales archaeon]